MHFFFYFSSHGASKAVTLKGKVPMPTSKLEPKVLAIPEKDMKRLNPISLKQCQPQSSAATNLVQKPPNSLVTPHQSMQSQVSNKIGSTESTGSNQQLVHPPSTETNLLHESSKDKAEVKKENPPSAG